MTTSIPGTNTRTTGTTTETTTETPTHAPPTPERLVAGDPLHVQEAQLCTELRRDDNDLLLSGEDIRRLRKSVGMSQTELAQRLEYSKSQICLWESGRYLMPYSVYERFWEVLATRRRELQGYHTLMDTISSWPTAGTWGGN